MEKNNLVLSNEEAAKLFVKAGYHVLPEEIFPVKLERVAFRKTFIELYFFCCNFFLHSTTVFLRMYTVEILELLKFCTCFVLNPSQCIIFNDGTSVVMTYFSPMERKFSFEKLYKPKVRYQKVVIPDDLN